MKYLIVLACFLTALGCKSPRTQIMVVVDSDMAVPSQLDSISFEITGPEGQMRTATADPATGLPTYLGMLHEGGPLSPVDVRVTGLRGGVPAVMRQARVAFQLDRTVVLEMHLLASCATTVCGAGQTCAESGCRSVDVGAVELEDWTGTPPTLDGGTPPGDSGMDSAVDTAVDTTPDVPVDTTPPCVPAAEVCNGMDDDCDMMVDEDFDLMTDLANCGTCDNVCMLADATPVCTAGACEVESCDGIFLDCDADPATGCEVDPSMDDLHCGGCDMPCGVGAACDTGVCTCTPPFAMGASGCVDTSRDPLNCGAVGTVCDDREICSGGTCGCRPGLTDDGASLCVDTMTDPSNCGSIGNVCGGACRSGSCRVNCPGSTDDCSDACTDISTDVLNCGACGTVCTTTQVCVTSACRDFDIGLGCTSCPCTTCAAGTTCCTYPGMMDVLCVDGPCP